MLATLNDVLPKARKQGYAVGLFNTVNLEMAKGVLAAAEELQSPVIIGTAEVLLPAASLEDLAPLLVSLAEKSTVPVVLHFDHGLTPERIYRAIDLGFSSVMYDCSMLSLEKNTEKVRDMTAYAHQRGVSVEAELGHVGDSGEENVESLYTNPAEAAVFAGETQVDALAVAVGTLHGAYRKAPQLRFDLLRELAAAVPVPLVLHGGSGLSEEDFKKAIAMGIAKINIFTDINMAAARSAAQCYAPGKGMTDLMPCMTQAVKETVMEKIRIFGSSGRA